MHRVPRNPPFELTAGHPALDLVNTLDWRFRRDENGQPRTEELMASYGELLRFAEESGLLSTAQARRLRQVGVAEGDRVLAKCRKLREAAASFLYAMVDSQRPDAEGIRVLESYFQRARAEQTLVYADGKLSWQWAAGDSSEGTLCAELPLWMLALSAQELMISDNLARLRACERDDCRWLFLDTSKNHTRRWCNMKVCGNRVKAERFRASRKLNTIPAGAEKGNGPSRSLAE